jgi:hypothetical protein
MGRRSLLLLLMLVPLLAACALPGTDAAEANNCVDSFLEGVHMGTPGAFDEDEVKDRVRPVCEAMVKAGLSDASSESEVIEFLKANPEMAGEMCEASASTSQFAAIVAAFGGYVSRGEVMRAGRDTCVYGFTEGFLSLSAGLDVPAIFRTHPYLAAPFCRAPLMQAYDAKKPPQPRAVYEDVVTEACMEGIRTGVVDYRTGNVLAPAIDEQGFRRLLDVEWAKRS